jgi:hypothetical protein
MARISLKGAGDMYAFTHVTQGPPTTLPVTYPPPYPLWLQHARRHPAHPPPHTQPHGRQACVRHVARGPM